MKLKYTAELDPGFAPLSVACREMREAVKDNGQDIAVGVERNDGYINTYRTRVYPDNAGHDGENFRFVERIVKSLLWIYGGHKIIFAGSPVIGEKIKKAYALKSDRDFDADLMARVYEKDFTVELRPLSGAPADKGATVSTGRHLSGCRIGFDAGGSDRKVSAVIDGEAVFSEEVIWHPKTTEDPDYHLNEIVSAFRTAASHMPRVDAVGVSSAGIYINNRVLAASLFIKVSKEDFERKVKDIYINAAAAIGAGIPLEVANDGDVTALAGAMELSDDCVLGVAMGTSQAGGYVDENGNITGWLNELAFVPVDYSPDAALDEWSGDIGTGVNYFSQDAVIKLAPAAGIELDNNLTPAEKLKAVQELMERNDARAAKICLPSMSLSEILTIISGLFSENVFIGAGRMMSASTITPILPAARPAPAPAAAA